MIYLNMNVNWIVKEMEVKDKRKKQMVKMFQ